MTEYELYQILDENGFEPSEENLDILIEGLDDGTFAIGEDGMLYEGIMTAIGHWRGRKMAKRERQIDAINAKGDKITAADRAKRTKLQGQVDAVKNKITQGKRLIGGTDAILDGRKASHEREVEKAETKLAKKAERHNIVHDRQNRLTDDREPAKQKLHDINASMAEIDKDSTHAKKVKLDDADKTKVKLEDYALYKLLDNNGFEPTNENLEILKEGLYNGDTVVLSVGRLPLNESMGDEVILAQILFENGFKVNDNNISVLAEAIENGHVLLEDDTAKPADSTDEEAKARKKKAAKVALGVGAAILGAAAGGASGYGLGKLNAEKGAEAASAAAADAKSKLTDADFEVTKKTNELTSARNSLNGKGGQAAVDAAHNFSKAEADLAAANEAKKVADDNAKLTDAKSTLAKTDAHKNATVAKHVAVGTVAGAGAGAGVGVGIAAAHAHRKKKKEAGTSEAGAGK